MDLSDSQTIDAVMLATDFSERSAAAERLALEMAVARGAALHIVNAIEPIMGVDDQDEEAAEFEDFYEKLLQRADREVEKRIEAWQEHNIIVRHHVQIGPRWRVILDYAESANVDVLVLGRRSYEVGDKMSFGTTSQKVFFGSSRPVLFVPSES